MTCPVQRWFAGWTAVAVVIALPLLTWPVPEWSDTRVMADDPPRNTRQAPPPLTLDMDAPLLLEEADHDPRPTKQVSASVAENNACYVCHANYKQEPFVRWHAKGDVGCVDCHGKSYAHRNDENNTTPPDIMFPRQAIDDSCELCHVSHDVPAREVLARMTKRKLPKHAAEPIACTDCHGQHRLKLRTVVWDRNTGRLLTGNQEPSSDQ